MLGFLHYQGGDYTEAVKWYRLAAERCRALSEPTADFLYTTVVVSPTNSSDTSR